MTKAAERALAMQKKKTAITAAMEVLTDYLVETPKTLGFKVSKDSGYYYITTKAKPISTRSAPV